MRILIRPAIDQHCEIDVTKRLVAAIAEELWLHSGGNDQVNWLEAELHLERIIGESRVKAATAEFRTTEMLASPQLPRDRPTKRGDGSRVLLQATGQERIRGRTRATGHELQRGAAER